MIGFSRAAASKATKAGVPAETLPSPPSGGRWALSRILWVPAPFGTGGSWTTAAMAQSLAPQIHAHYPPLNATKTAYTQTHALVWLQGALGTPDVDTDLLPDLTLDASLGAQAASVQTLLESRCPRYRYTDWAKAVVGKPLIPVSYTSGTLLRTVLADVRQHFEQSTQRPRPAGMESHNTEFLDPFTDDPATRWTVEEGGYVWDSTNFEMDATFTGTDTAIRYSANGPGSIEHEAQVTGVGSQNKMCGAAVRMDNAGVDDAYFFEYQSDSAIKIVRYLTSAGTQVASIAVGTWAAGDFFTVRGAAAGAAGANVVLSAWLTDHGSPTKPGDPGWIGVDASPDGTFTDTDANRLDATSHAHGGVGCRTPDADYDTRLDFFKVRAISDRAGGPAPASRRRSTLPLLGVQ